MILFFIVLIPFLFSIAIYFYGERSDTIRRTLTVIPSVITLLLVVSLSSHVLNGGKYSLTVVDSLPFSISFNADPFSIYLGLLITFLWLLTNFYAFGYMEKHPHALTRFFSALTFVLGATMGIIFSSNLVSFFIFFELLTAGVYPLVIHDETEAAYRAGVKYGAYLLLGGIFVLLGTAATYAMTGGNISFTPGGIPELAGQSKSMLLMLFLLFFFGFGFKSAIMPLHSWLPDAMIAPTPVSAVLHAVVVVNVGLCGFYRVVYGIFGIPLFKALHFNIILAVPAAITVVVSAIIALKQDEIKRMLAFSTVNQLSYVLLGIASCEMVGMLGGLLHVVYHSFMKITLFYCAGAIITRGGIKHISKMGGLAKKMPITMAAFTITAIGIIGLPPVAGWVSKWYLVQGYLSVGKPVFASVFIISGIIELGYLGPPILLAYFGKQEGEAESEHGHEHAATGVVPLWSEAPLTMLVPIVIVCIGSVIYGLWGFIPHRVGEIALKGLMGL